MNWKVVPLLLVGFAFLCACGGGGGGNPPPPPTISVAFATAPPGAISIGGTASVSASVSNDSAKGGVNWGCSPSGSCGTFSLSSTASGAMTMYTAPATVPTGGAVMVMATSVTDSTKSVQANVTVTGPTITVQISQAPPATLSTSGTATVAATTNDSAGVTWSCTPAGTCGSFNPTKTLTTATTTYTAPASVPTGGQVTLIATSVTDTTKNATSSPVTITGTASVADLKGQYAFLITAPTGLRGTTAWIGSVSLDGNGGVTGGEEEISSPSYNGDVADPILATTATGSISKYTVDASGHGRLIMSTSLGEALAISFVLTSASHAEVIEADGTGGFGGDPASGTLDRQTPTATGFSVSQISGTYSFTMNGTDVLTTGNPHLAFGGEFTTDGTGAISGGEMDVTSTAATIANEAITLGSKVDTGPDSNGRGTLHFAVTSPFVPRSFVYYIVNSKVMRILEADGNADMGGSAYLQGSASTTLTGNYVYQHAGWSSKGRSVAAGQFSVTVGGSTISAGISDSNAGGTPPTTPTTATAVSGSFSPSATESATVNFTNFVDASGTSSFNAYFVDPSINILDPNNASGGGGALLLHTDSNTNGTGILLMQATPTALAANYAVNLTNSIASTTPNELDLVGVLSGGSGLADYDENDSTTANPMIGAAFSASVSADAAHVGRSTGNVTVTQPASSTTGTPYPFIPSSPFSVALYATGNAQAFVVETDTHANLMGHVLLQQLP